MLGSRCKSLIQKFNLILFVITSVSNYSLPQMVEENDSNSGYKGVINYLKNLQVGSEISSVQDELTFIRDVGVFKLFHGKIYTCSSYHDKVLGLYFEGEGEFSFIPSTNIEQDQLYRFYEKDDFPVEFSKLFLLFTDSTYHELNKLFPFKKEEIDTRPNSEISVCVKYLIDSDEGCSRSDFLRSVLDGAQNGFFYSHIEGSGKPLFYQVNPYEDEEVTFVRPYKTALFSKARKETINQFPAGLDSKIIKTEKHFLNIITYKIESTIEDNLDFSAECTIDFTTDEKKQRWTTFYLYEELEADSIIWEDGRAANFYRMPLEKDVSGNEELWLNIDDRFQDGEQHNFKLYYHGDLLERDEDAWISIKSSINWYPVYNFLQKAYFGLKFNTPARYSFVSVGNLIRKKKDKEVLHTTWMCNEPIRNASFNIGKFEVHEVIEKDLPTVKVYMSQYGHNKLKNRLSNYGITSIGDALVWIGADVVNSLSLFSELFGKINQPTVNITEVPYFHGETFPGLIHLSWITYEYSIYNGFDQIFRAHEVAHQWWGVGVDFKTYHDQWLCEGFAQYCGLWYLQAAKNNNDLFFETLERWGDEILSNRKSIFGSGQEAGPIWLGYRTQSTDTEGDYWLLIYKKGAFVLHMLRGMLLDLKTMNEDLFINMMKDYYKTYRGTAASTEDFMNIVSKHFGEDMSWFFNQFVYGTDLPVYKFSYYTQKTEEGKYLVTCKVIQEEVPEDFKMYIPLKIVFPDDKVARLRIEMNSREKVFTLPLLPVEPDEIVFNDLNAVLCEVDYESWD